MRITELGIVSRQICINLFIYLYMYLLVYGIRIYIYEYVYMLVCIVNNLWGVVSFICNAIKQLTPS